MKVTLYSIAQRFAGKVFEIPGEKDHPLIQWWFHLCNLSMDTPDEVPWCSACINGLCDILNLPRSRSAAARSWLTVGEQIPLSVAVIGWDVLILNSGGPKNPMVSGPAHVTIYAGVEDKFVWGLGGNQSNQIKLSRFLKSDILGVRRLYKEPV